MSLESPTFFEKAWQQKRLIGIVLACMAGLGLFLWIIAYQGSCSFRRGQNKTKEAINANIAEIGNLTNQITNLEIKREGVREGVKGDMQDLQRDIYGREEAKREANQALANYQRAVNANSNIDRTAEDLNRILRELEK